MTVAKTRKAEILRTLVFYDQPQLLVLRKGKLLYLAIAVPSESGMMFLATSIQPRDWEYYLANRHDLRYLFTFPVRRIHCYFDLLEAKGSTVTMEIYDGVVPENHLPAPRIFASDHTETEDLEAVSGGIETLFLDGDWDLPELGRFQQKLSDVYTFLYSIDDWKKATSVAPAKIDEVRNAFTKRPFQGGGSYGAYFSDLNKRLKVSERVRLKSIEKASPGNMKIGGVAEVFADVQHLIENYLDNRKALVGLYRQIYALMSEKKLLARSVKTFSKQDPNYQEVEHYMERLAAALDLNCSKEVQQITGGNPLGSLKIILAMYRRIESSAEFFAQGRASFDKI